MVSITAFQAVDPGSIPGRRILRIFFFFFFNYSLSIKIIQDFSVNCLNFRINEKVGKSLRLLFSLSGVFG